MTINQAFELLKKSGGIRAARIITDEIKNLSWFRAHIIAHRLRSGTPVAKIIHKKWFYGLEFYTNHHTLDPRPDTETLVESVINDKWIAPKILDLGTGTGCIIVALVKNIDSATGTAVDISRGALRVARRNIKKLNLRDRIKIKHGSFANQKLLPHEKFDIIVSNPPYIAYGDPRVDAGAKHDPKIALYAKKRGMAAYEQIAKNAKNWIAESGKLYIEIGAGGEVSVRKIFESHGWQFVRATRDLSGITRVLVFKF
ncbi:MAG: peptide chain release factor N(5)-glutamine methyltransferase [Alphaproteobacteria bacterium]|nr:peptide chain release factor N(5)-glutamine methyltransferase [Alphaproteobacteria bacterium]